MTDRVLSAVLEALRRRDGLSGRRLETVTVGESAVLVEYAVETSAADSIPATDGRGGDPDATRLAGLAHRPAETMAADDSWPTTDPIDRLESLLLRSDEDPGARLSPDDRLARAIGIAAVNALSAPYVAWRPGDPMALLDPAVETVVTVGLFRPAFRKFADVEVRVIEREAIGAVSTPDSVALRTYLPADVETAMDGAEVVFVTGSALVYGGIERYLSAAPDDATVVVIGATASLLPAPLFDAGADVVAGAEVVDIRRVRAAITRGACGTALHDHGVRKVYAVRTSPSTIDLKPDTQHGTE